MSISNSKSEVKRTSMEEALENFESEVEEMEDFEIDDLIDVIEEDTENETILEMDEEEETSIMKIINSTPGNTVKVNPKEDFKRGIVRESVDISDDDDDDDFAEEEDVLEEEETDEYEDAVEEVDEEDLVDEDALKQELLANTLHSVLQEKEELINEYLLLRTQSNRLKLRNMYLQDYLYKLCWRKKLLYENLEKKQTRSFNTNRALSKARRRKRKLDKKMMNHYKAFIEFKRRPVELPEFKIRKEDKLKREKRLRRLLQENLRAPEFEKKIDKRIIHFRKKEYYREFRSIGRNWLKLININVDKLKEAQQNPKKPQETRIYRGIKMGYKRKPRVMIEKKGKPVYVVTKDGKVIDDEGNIVDKHKLNAEKDMERKGKNMKRCLGTKNKYTTEVSTLPVLSASDAPTITSQKTTAVKVRTQVPESNYSQDGKKRQIFAARSKSRAFFLGSRSKHIHQSYSDLRHYQQRHHHRHHHHTLNLEERLEKLKNGPFVQKMPCKHKDKRFVKLNWFRGDELIGRKSLGDTLQLSEKQHVINFVEDAIENTPHKKRAVKLKLKQLTRTNLINWDQVMQKYIILLKDCWELQVQHKKSMEENFADWSLWERRNQMCVDGLVVLLKSFTYQPNFSQGLARSFSKDVEEFASILRYVHSGLMRQLIKLYKNKLSLAMVERKVKDTANPALVNNGYTAEQYASMDQDNHILYLKLGRIEQQLQDEQVTLGKVLKRAKAMHEKRHLLKKLVIHDKIQSKTLSDTTLKKANKVQAIKDKLSQEMEDNWHLFFNGSLHEKPRLMNDFGMRKLLFNQNDRERKTLKRELYLRRREQRTMQIKMLDVKARLQELQVKGALNQNAAVYNFHKKNIAKSGIDQFATLSVAHCDSKLFENYKKTKLRKTSKTLSESLDQWF